MFTNQCSKCGEEFETKNPKRVICPNCLYPEGAVAAPRPSAPSPQPSYAPQPARHYPPGGGYGQQAPGGYNQGGYAPRPQQRPYGPPQGRPQQRPYGPPQGRPQPTYGGGYNQPGAYGQQAPGGYPHQRPMRPPGGFGGPRPQGMGRPGFGPPRPGGRPGGRPGFGPPRPGGRPPNRGPKKLLVTKEQLVQIEQLYKQTLPLPNPDVHEVIGAQINLAPSKVFFGINLVREKMKLLRLEYPKRKLAVTPEQLMAIETLYDPYLPLPPIGIHKIISKQLRMDEWRVHVAIGLIRKNRNLSRWNEDRDDLPEEMRIAQQKAREEKEKEKAEKEKAEKEKAKAAKKDSKKSEDASAAETAPEPVGTPEIVPEPVAETTVDASTPEPALSEPLVATTATKEAMPEASSVSSEPAAEETPSEEAAAPVKRPRATRTRKTAAKEAEPPAEGGDAEQLVVVAAPKRTRAPRASKEK